MDTAHSLLSELKGISFASINIRSLYRNVDELSLILQHSKLDLLLIQETFLNSSISDPHISIDGYTLLRKDHTEASGKKSGGGLVAYANTDRKFQHIPEHGICTPDFEAMWIRLSLPDTRDTFIANVYQRPDGDPDKLFQYLTNKLELFQEQRTPDMIIMGDMNSDVGKNGTPKQEVKQF